MKAANYGPVYACIYPGLAEITRKHGYALAAHGSMARDFDLVCIPWAETVSHPEDVIKAITTAYAINQAGEPEKKNHGRVAYTISLSFGECRLDLSFMPALIKQMADSAESEWSDDDVRPAATEQDYRELQLQHDDLLSMLFNVKQERDELMGLIKAVAAHSTSAMIDGTRCAAFPWSEYEVLMSKIKGGTT